MAYFAQSGKIDGNQRERGVGQFARVAFTTPQGVQTVAREICAGQ
jgi:hypothetical protein